MTNSARMALAATTISSPDPRKLADFYAGLLGWPVAVAEDGWVQLSAADGGPGLSFYEEPNYDPPAWPALAGQSQMQMHSFVVSGSVEL